MPVHKSQGIFTFSKIRDLWFLCLGKPETRVEDQIKILYLQSYLNSGLDKKAVIQPQIREPPGGNPQVTLYFMLEFRLESHKVHF